MLLAEVLKLFYSNANIDRKILAMKLRFIRFVKISPHQTFVPYSKFFWPNLIWPDRCICHEASGYKSCWTVTRANPGEVIPAQSMADIETTYGMDMCYIYLVMYVGNAMCWLCTTVQSTLLLLVIIYCSSSCPSRITFYMVL